MIGISVPSEWQQLSLPQMPATVMVIGASDTGKSTLARYLYERLCRQGVRAAYLDTDVGQSTLGVPTSMHVAVAGTSGDDTFPPSGPRGSFFVGATTPRGHMLPVVVGAYRLQQKARSLGAEAIVVDTSGLVSRVEGGLALKHWKTELLAPDLLIGLQRNTELEPVLWPLRRDARVRCAELRVLPQVVVRCREERIARRRELLSRYFERSGPLLVELRRIAVYGVELLTVSAIAALQDAEGFVLGLAVVDEVDRHEGTVVVSTPLMDRTGLASVRFGALRWDRVSEREL